MRRTFWFATILGMSLSALAGNNLPGYYEGKIREVNGYPGQAGEPCIVKIETRADYGGSTAFSVNDVDQFLFETTTVNKVAQSERRVIRLVSPPRAQGGDIEIVVMKLGENRWPVYLKMLRKNDYQHTLEKSIDCEGLVRR
jgi:hypothetical protein